MVIDNDFISQLISCDIVVWNGVIAQYGSVKGHMSHGDMLRLATDEEIKKYKTKQQNGY
jgi:hypothetical protein